MEKDDMPTVDRADSFARIVEFVRSIHGDGVVPLHRPVFAGPERQYLVDCIDSNFVSSVGPEVERFEKEVAAFVGSTHAVAAVNGTAALQVALTVAGVRPGDEVVTQALTFVATCNAIHHAGARPLFVDVDRDTMGMSPDALDRFLSGQVELRDGSAFNRLSGRRISACIPMHTFGHPCRIAGVVDVARQHGIPVIEDAAESLGSRVGSRHAGTFGIMGMLSFNGNKVITTGGGGMVVTDDAGLATRIRHLTTTAKVPHPYEFVHDEIGYNYRMPNLNAALGCAQMQTLPGMLAVKAGLAARYAEYLGKLGFQVASGCGTASPNHWLNAVVLRDREERDRFLEFTNSRQVMTRPIWRLMPDLAMFRDCQHDGLENSRWLEDRVVNLPSSVPESEFGRLAA